PRRSDHGPLAPGRGDLRRPLLRLHVEPAEPAELRRQVADRAARCGALPRHDHRGRRLRRSGPPAGRRRRALREELTWPPRSSPGRTTGPSRTTGPRCCGPRPRWPHVRTRRTPATGWGRRPGWTTDGSWSAATSRTPGTA